MDWILSTLTVVAGAVDRSAQAHEAAAGVDRHRADHGRDAEDQVGGARVTRLRIGAAVISALTHTNHGEMHVETRRRRSPSR
jgi:hypothetical protein